MPSITFWTRLEPFTRLDDIDAGLQAQRARPALAARAAVADRRVPGRGRRHAGAGAAAARARAARALPRRPATAAPRGAVPHRRPARGARRARARAAPPTRAATCGSPPRPASTSCGCSTRFGSRSPAAQAFAARAELALAAAARGRRRRRRRAGATSASWRGRVPDGFRVYEPRAIAGRPARRRAAAAAGGARRRPPEGARRPARAFLDWFDARYSARRPRGRRRAPRGSRSGWSTRSRSRPRRRTAASSSLSAAEYPGGTLDWHSFDVDPGSTLGARPADPRPETVTRTVIPRPSATRAWRPTAGGSSRTRAVNFNRIEGDPDELLRLLLVEFALLYCNDWFVAPGRRRRPGALFRLESLVVTDAFGERTLVPHYSRSHGPTERQTVRADVVAASSPSPTDAAVPAAGARGQPARRPVEEVSSCATSSRTWSGPSSGSRRASPAARSTATSLPRAPRPRPGAPRPEEPTGDALATASPRPCPTTGSRSSRGASTRPSPTSACGAPRRSSTRTASPASRARSAGSSSPSAPT